ncbi:gamma-glutamyl-gamma-aminobutyrate hydrolase family protein [Piscinibacter koreensis]|uniref:Gamma-glutamyl-gamma-aminobutyrate hydrolase family protein n=1 Tax=Piscinibacter koreensis TaxID=2742824 RepID=A0A7Y6TXF5_9BURK|nr:gamma-glutamyl-gamma-aminobutyrate hydrolase family protein [Schlegelella koreensis]NUZ06996.1 gamma-glutamyl-gamma-aminobutyrate hydrolase family protein [Schlegelella koreensis]
MSRAEPPAPERVPCVWVVASHRQLTNEHGHCQPYTLVDEGGTRAVLSLGMQPVSFPHVPPGRLGLMLDGVDAVFLGGSATNVHPRHFGEEPADPSMTYDDTREAVSLPLVRLCIERGIPLLGVCRGSHEINVAMGGSMHQSLQALAGSLVHWENPEESLDEQYAERHHVNLVAGGELERLTGCQRFAVSSLHSQGVKRLGGGLVVEANADDGLIEAFRWHDRRQFAWGFQFHPEWRSEQHPYYTKVMAAFVDACWARMRKEGPRAAGAKQPPDRLLASA